MESVYGDGSSRLVATELSHIKDLVMQLETHLDGSSHERCRHLASQIFSLTEQSIGMITSSNFDKIRKRSGDETDLAPATISPLSAVDDVPVKPAKKRKTMPKHHVKVEVAEGGEAPVDDGHSWRKYGQKPILGAQHPRSYYRCRHRHSQGCTAMKKVQRADEDPTLFDVIYYGIHSCVETTSTTEAAGLMPAPALEQNDPDFDSLLQSLSGSGSLAVKTEGLAAAMEPHGWNDNITPFCPSSTLPENWSLLPATSNVTDEFFDIDVISSFFS